MRALRNTAVGVGLLVAMGAPAFAQSIVVQGNQRVDAATIRSYAQGSSPEQIRQDLLATGLFSSVSVSQRGGQVVVSVKENEVINRVVFQGNKKLKSDQLEAEVQSKARGPFSRAQVDADVQRLRDVYQRSGRGLASVSSRIVPLENGRVDVVFDVVEGEKTGVKQINFSGNEAFSSGRLRDQMTTTESNLLSFLKNSDVYDPDRIASDLELLRRFYLKHGYADFRVVSNDVKFDEAAGGYIVNIVVDEGRKYDVGEVNVESRIPDIDAQTLRSRVKTSAGDTYNAEDVEKSLQAITTEVASKGYAFAQVRPQGAKDPATGKIGIVYVVEEGPRVYIERINIRGNTRTRDNVIRREFDVGEGDAYNKVLMDKAERRLNNLGFFKRVRITNEPGSTPDRVIVNVDVEDQPTGQFSVAGGYSTADGFIAEVSLAETNFLGRGQFVRAAASLGQYSSGVEFSFTEPYFMDRRIAAGFDLFSKQTDNTRYSYYENRTTGGTLRMGLPITEETTALLRYSLYQTDLTIPNTTKRPYNDCWYPIPGFTPTQVIGGYTAGQYPDCVNNGEASIALKQAAGTRMTSLAGFTLNYNTLDNNRNPRNGLFAEWKQDFAGLGGDSQFIRATGEVRYYRELSDDFVGMLKVQGGQMWGNDLLITDQFFLGPSLVRGFAPGGLGPRDASDPRNNALGGTTYFGGSAEVQFPIFGLPRELGMRGAVFADAGTLFGYKGGFNFNAPYDNCPVTNPNVQTTCLSVYDSHQIRSSVGASLLWQSPLGPIRFDYAIPLSKAKYDQTQYFRFSGGTSF
ncbi:outer membrane protein assembly factor BamA [Alsobacter sp. SYSU M60028]|uniref:Outer membrane protein assembly factor BamA n=1 Tax=Alsobacter ponti TaxID=2962936 RepID=A0ABT1LB57_9HYPH|nr:outer membrane protein assembly factor BamA [Alsobacter ponti]MCP8938211.1 outer membrane protein assembly factor BamA [Alsobacter ponti]